jgi:phosphotransacetylase
MDELVEMLSETLNTCIARGMKPPLARISHSNKAHRGSESAKVVVLQRLYVIREGNPDAHRV